MAESAGEVYIDISARLDKLNAALASIGKEGAPQAEAAGEEVGEAFAEAAGDEMEAGAESAAKKFAEEIKDAGRDEMEKAGEELGSVLADATENAAKTAAPKVAGAIAPDGGKIGNDVGKQFAAKFAAFWGEKGASQISTIFAKLLGPLAAAKLADTMAEVIRGKPWQEALTDSIESIPFVGSFYRLGEAIHDELLSSVGETRREVEAAEAELNARMDARRNYAVQKQAEEKAMLQRVNTLRMDQVRLDLERQVAEVRAEGDEAETVKAEARMRAALAYRDLQLAIANTNNATEIELLRANHKIAMDNIDIEANARLNSIYEQRRQQREAEEQAMREQQEMQRQQLEMEQERLAAIEAQAQARKDAAMQAEADSIRAAEIALIFERRSAGMKGDALIKEQALRDNALRDLKEQQELEKAMDDDVRDLIRRRYDLENELAAEQMNKKLAAEQAAAGQANSAATALGSFTFDPYPAERMKEVQERTMRAAEKTAENSTAAAVGVY